MLHHPFRELSELLMPQTIMNLYLGPWKLAGDTATTTAAPSIISRITLVLLLHILMKMTLRRMSMKKRISTSWQELAAQRPNDEGILTEDPDAIRDRNIDRLELWTGPRYEAPASIV